MNSYMLQLESLADRVQRGDSAAAADLRRRLTPGMVYKVREVLRAGQGVSSLERRILAEASRALADNPDHSSQDEALVRQIAQRLCDTLGHVRAPLAAGTCCLGETVRV
jgi:hypothetical protein